MEHAKIFRPLKCENADSDIFRVQVQQYTNWCQCVNLTFRCTNGTFSVKTWHGLVKQFRCSDRYW